MKPWIATYRLQMHAGFPLDAAREVLPYLAALGISHVYLSPCLQATRGSTHGYDVADPTRISDDLGGEAAWTRFQAAVRAQGLGVLLDIVPNHMTTATENPWWRDVLAHGPFSAYAGFFDLMPEADGEPWRVRLCTLGRPYPEVLEAGELSIDVTSDEPRLAYHDQRWPLAPLSWRHLGPDAPFAAEAAGWRANRQPDRATVERYRATVAAARAWWRQADRRAEAVAVAAEPGRLHALLEEQYYRLVWWKLEGEMVNYRRFFNIGTLVGLRVEDPAVFAAAHERIQKMVTAGEIDGLRVDHPDGLRDPEGYLRDLRRRLPEGRIYIEKILDAEELLPEDWPVDGTVGYEFLAKVNRLWMAAGSADVLTGIYADFTEHPVNFPRLVREKKLAIIEAHFEADLERLVALAHGIARRDWRTQDLSRGQLRDALGMLTAVLPIYRTYRRGEPVLEGERDLAVLDAALAQTRANLPHVGERVPAFLRRLLCDEPADEAERDFVARWQQLAPAVMAKGAEDTTFYLYDRLVSCNEVGASPSLLGIPAEQFHAFCHGLHRSWPGNLLASSTHDTKRSEDVRARISVLTELPERWAAEVRAWSAMNEPAWAGRSPDRHAEYLLYQTLVGAWPISAERARDYMLKACREAKVMTSWHEPDERYEQAVLGFTERVLASEPFAAALEAFVMPLVGPGRINSLAQTLIKLTAPGVPDFYQGTEQWDLSLVDPDNRRPVDFEARRARLARLADAAVGDVLAEWEAGDPKLWLIARALRLRRERPAAFGPEAGYEPLTARGGRLAHLLAYGRGGEVLVAVPRFTLTLAGDWGDTMLGLPAGRWRNVFTEVILEGEVRPAELFGVFPVALLAREPEAGGRATGASL